MYLKLEKNIVAFGGEYISWPFLSHSITMPNTALAVPTDEPCVGGQAGLVIVLVGTGADCVWSHPAVHQVVSQPRPA